MSTLYLFGIGGTGSRVMRSLTMLLAAGVRLGSNVTRVVPVIIDPDKANGDLTRTIELMIQYRATRAGLGLPQPNMASDFFLTELDDMGTDFRLPIANIANKTFGQFIQELNLDTKNRALVQLLFSEKNLATDLEVGFKGNPNIGSVVLNDFTSLQGILQNFQQGDRIFIISSIFGGTGAAGFPLLLKTLRNAQNYKFPNGALLSNAPIGAITVLPYFGLKADEHSEIKMETFISKAKAALTYYENNIDTDALYYITDALQMNYDNVEGASAQQNLAHFVELAAALAVVDFTNEDIPDRVNGNPVNAPYYKEFATAQNHDPMILPSLSPQTQGVMSEALCRFYLFAQTYFYHLNSTLDAVWAKQEGVDASLFGSAVFSHLTTFLQGFYAWLNELAANKRGFAPFQLGNVPDVFQGLNGIEPKKSGFFERLSSKNLKGYTGIDDKMARHSKALHQQFENKADYVVELLYRSVADLLREKFF